MEYLRNSNLRRYNTISMALMVLVLVCILISGSVFSSFIFPFRQEKNTNIWNQFPIWLKDARIGNFKNATDSFRANLLSNVACYDIGSSVGVLLFLPKCSSFVEFANAVETSQPDCNLRLFLHMQQLLRVVFLIGGMVSMLTIVVRVVLLRRVINIPFGLVVLHGIVIILEVAASVAWVCLAKYRTWGKCGGEVEQPVMDSVASFGIGFYVLNAGIVLQILTVPLSIWLEREYKQIAKREQRDTPLEPLQKEDIGTIKEVFRAQKPKKGNFQSSSTMGMYEDDI
jgi:hypothetical protein